MRLTRPTFIFYISFLLSAHTFHAQDLKRIDSLKKLLPDLKDSSRIQILNQLASAYIVSDVLVSQKYSSEALALARKIQYKRGIVTSLNAISSSYMDRSMYDSARICLDEAHQLSVETGDKNLIMTTYSNLANLYQNTGDYSKSIGYMVQGLKLSEETENINMQSRFLTNIANNYIMQEKFAEAKLYFNKVLELKDISRNKEIMTYVNSGLGTIYFVEKNYGKALEVQINAKKYFFELGDKISMTTILENIGVTYTKLKEYEKAQEHFNEALKISTSIDDMEGLASINESIAQLLMDQKKYDAAIPYLLSGLGYAKKIGSKEYIKEAYRLLSECYAKKDDFKNAFEYNKLFVDIKDTMFNESTAKQMAQIQTQYESEKKEKTIQLMSKEIQLRQQREGRQRIVNYSLLVFSVLLLLLGAVSYNAYRIKKRTAGILEAKNTEIYRQNEQLENQRNLLSQKNELITDSINYAKRIQESVLTNHQVLKNYFPESFIFYRPKDIVSGDFFWLQERNGELFFAVVDCTGHGVPGAFMSIVGNDLLKQVMAEKGSADTAQILDELNKAARDTIRQPQKEDIRDGMDLALCSFDLKTKKLSYSGAKNPACIFSDGNFTELKADRISIGNTSDKKFSRQEFSLKSGDMIYLFSDGYADQKGGPNNKKFYYENLRVLLEKASSLPINEQEALIAETMDNWINGNQQLDDMMLLGIKIA